ncbi:MAG: response regulator transcription factor [Candidatus Phosphoribacter sp.]
MPDAAPTASRVLVVEDEPALAELVRSYLHHAGYAVRVVGTGPDALEAARVQEPDVVVLDLGLPGLDGIEVCRRLRTFSDCYVLMLTARTDELDTLIGLSVGADDYVTKPFRPRELLARIQVLLRRPRERGPDERSPGEGDPARAEEPARVVGALSVDVPGRQAKLDGRPVELTRTEFDLLAALTSRPGLAWSRRQLIDDVWDSAWVGDEHLVDVHVAHLRRKLGDDPANARYVVTVRGIGYRLGLG